MKRPTPWKARAVIAGAGGAAGVAGGLLAGPPGAVIGAATGLPIALVAMGIFMAFTVPSVSRHMVSYEPELALREARFGLWARQVLSRWWPGRFLAVLAAERLMAAEALWALGEGSQAPEPAAEAVAIYRGLVARAPGEFEAGLADALDRQARLLASVGDWDKAAEAAVVAVGLFRDLAKPAPGKYRLALARSLILEAVTLSRAGLAPAALMAAGQAASICQDGLPVCSAQAFLLQGRLLAGQGRHREAIGPLIKGWLLAIRWGQEDLLEPAAPALRAAYDADRAAVVDAWRAEADGEPLDWLASAPPGTPQPGTPQPGTPQLPLAKQMPSPPSRPSPSWPGLW